jgi:SAM-dependent methyltransferase
MAPLDPVVQELETLYGVSADVHEADHIFNFVATHHRYATRGDALREYLRTGCDSAARLKSLLSELAPAGQATLLEFASGYGCVTRHLQSALPSVRIVPCDIHREAVDFIKRITGLNGVLSRTIPEEARFDGEFDAVFALSFFSHMPKTTWTRWLRKLVDAAAPGGLIIFTTHGFTSAPLMLNPPLDQDGFWFNPHSEQADLSVADYGTTITSRRFVCSQIDSIPHARLIQFREGFWWGHQDLYVLKRSDTVA